MPTRIPRPLMVLALGAVMFLPLLGGYGLWDPAEIREADVARAVADSGDFGDPTVGGKYNRRPVLQLWLVAAGFKAFGVNELAGRLPLALCGIVALLLAFRLGQRLLSDNAGLAAALVLGTTPAFLFQGRQLIGDIAYYTCLLAAIGGLAGYLWPVDGRRSLLDLVIAGLGLALGFAARGLMLGTAFPLLCVGLALGISWRVRDRPPDAPASDDGGSPRKSVGTAVLDAAKPLALMLVLVAAAIGGLFAFIDDSMFMLLGTELHKVATPPTFEQTMKEVGFGSYPWFALLPLALFSFFWAQQPAAEQRDRNAPLKLLLVLVLVLGYLGAALWAGFVSKVRFPALPFVSIAVGVFAYETWQHGARHRLWALAAAGLVLALHQDFFMAPESLAFSHMLQAAKYPAELNIKLEMRFFGLTLALAAFLALGGLPRPFEPRTIRIDAGRIGRWPLIGGAWRGAVNAVGWVATKLGQLCAWIAWGLERAAGKGGRLFWMAGGSVALVFAGWCAFFLTPQLSLHMSNKALFGTYHSCRQGNEPLAQYLVPGRGASYYNDGDVAQIPSQTELFNRLKKPERIFVLVPATQLGALDQAARQAKIAYYVLDDSSSKYLMLSNRLAGACNEDQNPLRRLVLSQRPTPKHRVEANFENRVKMIGYDVDDTVSRGGKFKITFYYEVLSRMPAGYKVFIHFDQPAHRFHGDHVPLGGKYPTQYWLPGDFIKDPHEVEIPLLTTPSGSYNILTGFWLGSKRLKVVKGPNDGSDRVRVGTLRVR